MPNVFGPSANLVARLSIVGMVVLLGTAATVVYAYVHSSYATKVGVPLEQPIPFSHAHHVGGLGIDCRYCHMSVEKSEFAGMPTTDTCMNCHWQLYTESKMLADLRESWRTGEPIEWQRVHDLPDFVYFNHSIHIDNGVGCASCHGQVDQMPLMQKVKTLHMQFCLNCHRDPAPHLRPKDEIFNMDWQPPENREKLGQRLVDKYDIEVGHLIDCTICHR